MRQLIAHARSFETRCAERGADLGALEAGQSPEALFITCSDSRIAPTLITGADPGDLFELRTAGNIVPAYRPAHPAGEVATIEYALRVLGVRHVVVCGHSHCGAVGAMVRGDDLSAVPAVRSWLDSALPEQLRRSWTEADGEAAPDLAAPVQQHVRAQLERLRAYPCVREGVAAGRLSLHGWFYEVHTGAVLSHRPETGTFQPL